MSSVQNSNYIDKLAMNKAPNVPLTSVAYTVEAPPNEKSDPFEHLVHNAAPNPSLPSSHERHKHVDNGIQTLVEGFELLTIDGSKRVSFAEAGAVKNLDPPSVVVKEVTDTVAAAGASEDASNTKKAEKGAVEVARRERAEDMKKRFLLSSDPPLEGSTQTHSILKAYDKEEGMEVAFHRVRLRQYENMAHCPYHHPDNAAAPPSPNSASGSPRDCKNSPPGGSSNKIISLPTPQDFRCICPGKSSLTEVYIASKDDPRLWPIGHHPNLMTIVNAWIEPAQKTGRDFKSLVGDSAAQPEPMDFIFITPLVSAGTLQGYISRIDDVRLRVIRKWAGQLLEALSFLHSLNRAHGDIRLSNIHINGETGNVLLGAFNLDPGRTTESSTMSRALLHMAPEFVTSISPWEPNLQRKMELLEDSIASNSSKSKQATDISPPQSPTSVPSTTPSSPAKEPMEGAASQPIPNALTTLMKMFSSISVSESENAKESAKPQLVEPFSTDNNAPKEKENAASAVSSQRTTPNSPLSPASPRLESKANADFSESHSSGLSSEQSIHPSSFSAFKPTPASDIWALGLCLLEVSTKRSPYSSAASLDEAQRMKLQGLRPPELELILEVIEKEKNAAAEKRAELAALLANKSSESDTESTDPAQKKATKNQRTPSLLQTQITKHEERINDYKRFYFFLTEMLTPNPIDRPVAQELLKHDFLKHLGTDEAREQQAKDKQEKEKKEKEKEKQEKEKEEKERDEREKGERKREEQEREHSIRQTTSEPAPAVQDSDAIEEPRNVTSQTVETGKQEQPLQAKQAYTNPAAADAPVSGNTGVAQGANYPNAAVAQDLTQTTPAQAYDATQSISKPVGGDITETSGKSNITSHLAESGSTNMLRLDTAQYNSSNSPNTPTLRMAAMTPEKLLTPSSSMPNLAGMAPIQGAAGGVGMHPSRTNQALSEQRDASELTQSKRAAAPAKSIQQLMQRMQEYEEQTSQMASQAQMQVPSNANAQSAAQNSANRTSSATATISQSAPAATASGDFLPGLEGANAQPVKPYPPTPLIGVALRQIRYSKGGVTFTITLYQATASAIELQKNTTPNREEAWENGYFQYPPDVRYFLVQYTVDEKQVQFFDSKVVAAYFAFEKYILERDIPLLSDWLQVYVSPAIQNPGEIYVFPRASLSRFNHPMKTPLTSAHQYSQLQPTPPHLQAMSSSMYYLGPQVTPRQSMFAQGLGILTPDAPPDTMKTPINMVQPQRPSMSPRRMQHPLYNVLPGLAQQGYPMHSQSEPSLAMNMMHQHTMLPVTPMGMSQTHPMLSNIPAISPHTSTYLPHGFASEPASPLQYLNPAAANLSTQRYGPMHGIPQGVPNYPMDKSFYESRIGMAQSQPQLWSIAPGDAQEKQNLPITPGEFFPPQ